MKQFHILVFALALVQLNANPLNDFLSSTLLGKKSEVIEKTYSLEDGILETTPAYIEIGELEFEGLRFKINVFFRDGECRGYGLWANQIQIKYHNGLLKHGNNVEIFEVFQNALDKLTETYGEAPRVKIESRCCGCESGTLSQTYSWVNNKYALVLMFHDNISSQSVTLRQYRRNEIYGEFTGEKDLLFIKKLYDSQSGVLPNDWPSTINGAGTSEKNSDMQNGLNDHIENYASDMVDIENNLIKTKQALKENYILNEYAAAFFILIVAFLCMLICKRCLRKRRS